MYTHLFLNSCFKSVIKLKQLNIMLHKSKYNKRLKGDWCFWPTLQHIKAALGWYGGAVVSECSHLTAKRFRVRISGAENEWMNEKKQKSTGPKTFALTCLHGNEFWLKCRLDSFNFLYKSIIWPFNKLYITFKSQILTKCSNLKRRQRI